ncbi:spore germination protein [Bacillus sp. SD088]|uniref:spore germination protein n=1 Tax=Bacillus sp. SD088 TaxID=2782012 RepID=UPI001A959184|nr:spore germination protein [Bacillus sp. SD088]MBO0993537.1 spore germination protein [Bacillus sp. SD088]
MSSKQEENNINTNNEQITNIKQLKQLFEKSSDVHFQKYTFNTYSVYFITCDAMINKQMLHDVIVERVKLYLLNIDEKSIKESIENQLHLPNLQKLEKQDDITTHAYTGHVILHFEDVNLIYSSDIADKPNRNPEETKTEVPVKGPRDNFIEDISVNIALVRKRLPTNSLFVEKFEIGKRTKTAVAILYFDDIVNKDIINGIKNKIEKIDSNIDVLFNGDILMEFIDKNSKLFPRYDYTGRPDFAVETLIRGRVFILVDGVAYGIITPVNLFLLFKTSEDNEYPVVFSSFERLLRVFGILVGTLLPAFWLALTTFHQNQLPLQLLATVVQSSTGLPFPAAFEMLIMLIMFELFREAGLRLPDAIGGTLSVVGGLIIGDAAIRAGITSPAMVVIIAVSVISTFTLVNQSFVSAVSMVRIFSIMVTALLGLFGFFVSLYVVLLYLANIRIFGVPYLSVTDHLKWSTIKQTFLRQSQKNYKYRPGELKTTDDTRLNEDEK